MLMRSRRSRSPRTRLTETRDAPVNAASSSCVNVSSSSPDPPDPFTWARSSRYLATRLGTSRKMRSSTRSDRRRTVLARASKTTFVAAGCASTKDRKSSPASSAHRVSSSAVAVAGRMGGVSSSGALTAVADGAGAGVFYELLAEIGGDCGLRPYLPHHSTDPVAAPDLDPRSVYEIDRARVARSALLIAYAGTPSFGVGIEVEIARERGIPVIVVAERDRAVSRILLGSPAVVA